MLLRSLIRSNLKGISVNNQPPPEPIQTQASKYPGLPRDVGKTTLGDYRMNSAVYEGMDVPPIELKEYVKPEVRFQTIGFNVEQPRSELGTASLISKLGDQKFKYARNDPYAKYMAYNKLERELKEAEKNASFTDLTAVREIVRDAVEKRRTLNEQDFLRKMLDSGLSMEDAKDEIENVRRANHLKEANLVDDRQYQSKMALKAFANRRGVLASIQEPLSHSGAIMNPQTSELLANAAGTPERGFGNSPLDMDRLMKSPGYYKRFLRKSGVSAEQSDRDAAIGGMIAEGRTDITQLSQIPSLERAKNIEATRENIAYTLDNLRSKKDRNITILPPTLFADDLTAFMNEKLNKKPGEKIFVRPVTFNKLTPSQLLFAINFLVSRNADNAARLKMKLKSLDDRGGFAQNVIKSNLIQLASELTSEGGETAKLPVILPFMDKELSVEQIKNYAYAYMKKDLNAIKEKINKYDDQLVELTQEDLDKMPTTNEPIPELNITETIANNAIGVATPANIEASKGRATTRKNYSGLKELVKNQVLENNKKRTELERTRNSVVQNSLITPAVNQINSNENTYAKKNIFGKREEELLKGFIAEEQVKKAQEQVKIARQMPERNQMVEYIPEDLLNVTTNLAPQPTLKPQPKKVNGKESATKYAREITKKPLNTMTKSELQVVAVELGISKYGNMDKLIEKIKATGKY
jgi:hypothetical protein